MSVPDTLFLKTKFLIKLHFVFVVKYRTELLMGKRNEDMQQIVFEVCAGKDWCMDTMQSDKDHLHLRLDIEPQPSASEIVHRIRQLSCFRI